MLGGWLYLRVCVHPCAGLWVYCAWVCVCTSGLVERRMSFVAAPRHSPSNHATVPRTHASAHQHAHTPTHPLKVKMMQELTVYGQTVDIFVVRPSDKTRPPCDKKCLQQSAKAHHIRLRWEKTTVHLLESQHMDRASRSLSGRYNNFAFVGNDVTPRDQHGVHLNVVRVALEIPLVSWKRRPIS